MAVLFVVPGLYWWFAHTKVVMRLFPIDESLISAKSWREMTLISTIYHLVVFVLYLLWLKLIQVEQPFQDGTLNTQTWLNICIAWILVPFFLGIVTGKVEHDHQQSKKIYRRLVWGFLKSTGYTECQIPALLKKKYPLLYAAQRWRKLATRVERDFPTGQTPECKSVDEKHSSE